MRIVSWSSEKRDYSSSRVSHMGEKMGGKGLRAVSINDSKKKDKRENKVGMYSEGLLVSLLRSEICLCFYSEQNAVVRVLGLKILAKKGDNGHRKVLEWAGGHRV